MIAKIIHHDSLIWLVLILVTLLTWFIIEGEHTNLAIITIVLLSTLKVYLIGISFMEIFRANKVFKIFYHVWIALVALMVTGFFITG